MDDRTRDAGSACRHPGRSPIDLAHLDRILRRVKDLKGAVIPSCRRRRMPSATAAAAMRHRAQNAAPAASPLRVATFYGVHLKRRGRHIVRVCDGTACTCAGGKTIEILEKEIGVQAGTTSSDYKMSWRSSTPWAPAGLAPVAAGR